MRVDVVGLVCGWVWMRVRIREGCGYWMWMWMRMWLQDTNVDVDVDVDVDVFVRGVCCTARCFVAAVPCNVLGDVQPLQQCGSWLHQ